ncbi:hypothetical protein D5086_000889 [Populus alba]|uniref:Uncharacterized protein n=1 Tax=Populus alba TaxID=43335 RepID=A0ACC4CXV7_POPAL
MLSPLLRKRKCDEVFGWGILGWNGVLGKWALTGAIVACLRCGICTSHKMRSKRLQLFSMVSSTRPLLPGHLVYGVRGE